jgi:hypothetical protein
MRWLLYPKGKNFRYTLDRTMGGPLSRSGRYGVEKNLLSIPEIEPLQAAIPTQS